MLRPNRKTRYVQFTFIDTDGATILLQTHHLWFVAILYTCCLCVLCMRSGERWGEMGREMTSRISFIIATEVNAAMDTQLLDSNPRRINCHKGTLRRKRGCLLWIVYQRITLYKNRNRVLVSISYNNPPINTTCHLYNCYKNMR